jgi:hypothetical protein
VRLTHTHCPTGRRVATAAAAAASAATIAADAAVVAGDAVAVVSCCCVLLLLAALQKKALQNRRVSAIAPRPSAHGKAFSSQRSTAAAASRALRCCVATSETARVECRCLVAQQSAALPLR